MDALEAVQKAKNELARMEGYLEFKIKNEDLPPMVKHVYKTDIPELKGTRMGLEELTESLKSIEETIEALDALAESLENLGLIKYRISY